MLRAFAIYSATLLLPHPAGPVTSQMCVCSPACPATLTGVSVLRDVLVAVAWMDGRAAADGDFCPWGTVYVVSKDIIVASRSWKSAFKKMKEKNQIAMPV